MGLIHFVDIVKITYITLLGPGNCMSIKWVMKYAIINVEGQKVSLFITTWIFGWMERSESGFKIAYCSQIIRNKVISKPITDKRVFDVI